MTLVGNLLASSVVLANAVREQALDPGILVRSLQEQCRDKVRQLIVQRRLPRLPELDVAPLLTRYVAGWYDYQEAVGKSAFRPGRSRLEQLACNLVHYCT